MTKSRSIVAALVVSSMLAGPALGASLCQKKKSGALVVRESCKPKEVAVDPPTIGVQRVIQGACTAGQTLQGINPDGTVSCAAVAGVARTLSFPARTLAFAPGEPSLGLEFDGIRWSYPGGAPVIVIPRITDWDGVSAVRVRIFFYPTTATAGTVQFFVRPRVYDPGDTFDDALGVESDAVPVGVADRYAEGRITIPAASFGTKAWWYLVFQRGIKGVAPYPDDVVITSIAIDYTAMR